MWTTCLVFFQSLIVAGYAYADVLASRLRPRAQVVVHTLVLGAALLLPAADRDRSLEEALAGRGSDGPDSRGPRGDDRPPLFRAVFDEPASSSVGGAPGRSPYRLYALSNVGSVAGLASHPFVVEPSLAIRAKLGSAAFLVFAAVSVAAGIRTVGVADDVLRRIGPREPARSTPIVTRFLWLALPACR